MNRIADIPVELHDEYKFLTRTKRLSAAETRKILGVKSD
jgi:hypothetical protein